MAKKANVRTRLVISVFFAVLGGAATVAGGGFGGGTLTLNYFYVDAVHGNDDNEGLTPGTAFATIQRGIDTAADNDIVLVYPGLYQEEINFLGKALVVQGLTGVGAGMPVLHNPGDFAVSFYSGEGPDYAVSWTMVIFANCEIFRTFSEELLQRICVLALSNMVTEVYMGNPGLLEGGIKC